MRESVRVIGAGGVNKIGVGDRMASKDAACIFQFLLFR